MKFQKANRIFACFCWLGAVVCVFLTGYLLRMAQKYPEMEPFTRFTRLVGVLALLWLAAAVWFTIQSRSGKRNGKK